MDLNKNTDSPNQQDVVVGRNAVLEALNAGKELDTLFVASGEKFGNINKIIATAKQHDVVVKEVNDYKLKALSQGVSHQGVVATLCATSYCDVEDIFELANKRGESPFIIICDEIEDPHNLGAIIRTAEVCGAHGVIIPKRRSASLTASVFKASAGALNHMLVSRVSNLSSTIDDFKKRGVWIYGAHMQGENWCGVDYSGSVALVIGSESNGIGTLIKGKCDVLVSLPIQGKINSLNASVAGGVLMYEITRQRLNIKAK
jgi:23S rRNA (guanosine2251-2'-O)-methyltransferase